MNDEFYIGWEAKTSPGIGKAVRKAVVTLLTLGLLLPVVLALSQRLIGVSVFEWGNIKSFSGILRARPYPHLLVRRPGKAEVAFSSYHLVAPFKFGLNPETMAALDGKPVGLKGTLIYRANQTMIEAQSDTIRPLGKPDLALGAVPDAAAVSLGRKTLVGEIVDSKCYLGVMNPGTLTPHRACAIRCISGGIPPVLLVRQTNGAALYFVLVARDGTPVNKQVLNIVAEPVEITGEVDRQDDFLILRADPSTYRRIGK